MNTLLRRLPVKPLLSHFRCTVSKPLCSFVNNSTSIVPKHEIFPNGQKFIATSFETPQAFYSVNVDSMYDFSATKIDDCSVRTCLSGTKYLASCNGLIGFWKPTNLDEAEDDIFLWNPTTREVKKLPRVLNILVPCRLIGVALVGFGYDHVNDDYKVMRTSSAGYWPRGIVVSVYSLKNNSWARAETISTDINLNSFSLYSKFGVFANGSLFWLGKGNIYAYDLGVHRISDLPFPPGFDKKNIKAALHDFNGCLCFIDTFPDSRLDMWVLNSNKVENSWSKLISVEKPGVLGSFEFIYPIAFSKARNEILLMVDDNRLVWYDRESNQVKNVALHGFPESFDLLDYYESRFEISVSELEGKQSEEEEKKLREDALRECLGGGASNNPSFEKHIKNAIQARMDRAKKRKGSAG